MPQEEKVALATPADRRRRRRGGFVVFVLFLIAVLGGLAAIVLSVNDGRNYRRVVRELRLEQYLLPPPPAPRLRVDRLRHVAPASRFPPWLVRRKLERAAVFERSSALTAEERCRQLENLGGDAAEYDAHGEEWECTLFHQFGETVESPSLFVQAKGMPPDDLRAFRIKMSFTDPAKDAEVLAAALAVLDRFDLQISPESLAYLDERMTNRTAFKSVLENYRATFLPEMFDQRRFNLLLVPRPATPPCGEGIAAALNAAFPAPLGCLPLPPGRVWALSAG